MVSLLCVTKRSNTGYNALLKVATTVHKTCTYLLCNCGGAINRIEDYPGDPVCVYFLPAFIAIASTSRHVRVGARMACLPLPLLPSLATCNASDFVRARRANIWNVTGSFMVAPTLYREPPPLA